MSDNIHPITPASIPLHLDLHKTTNISIFLWGSPGVSKSSSLKAYANNLGMALIDVRVGQIEAADLRGLPYPVNGGKDGIRWSAPQVLPRNINHDEIVTFDETDEVVEYYNPEGDNGIRYCTAPKIGMVPMNKEHEVVVLTRKEYFEAAGIEDSEEFEDSVSAMKDQLYLRLIRKGDESRTPVAGRARIRVIGEAKGILALEEMNAGNMSVQGAAYQLILDRRIGEYKVPNGVRIVALGNRESDKGVTSRQPLPLSNRFVHYEVISNPREWLDWAYRSGISPKVIGFIESMPGQLDAFSGSNVTPTARGFPTPRTWEMVSTILNENPNAPLDVLRIDITGAIGVTVGGAFIEFLSTSGKIPSTEGVLSGQITSADEMDNVALAMYLTANLIYALRTEYKECPVPAGVAPREFNDPRYDKFMDRFDNFISFVRNNFTDELCVTALRRVSKNSEISYDNKRSPNFVHLANEYAALMSRSD